MFLTYQNRLDMKLDVSYKTTSFKNIVNALLFFEDDKNETWLDVLKTSKKPPFSLSFLDYNFIFWLNSFSNFTYLWHFDVGPYYLSTYFFLCTLCDIIQRHLIWSFPFRLYSYSWTFWLLFNIPGSQNYCMIKRL